MIINNSEKLIMTTTELIITNCEETRKRSILLWEGLPERFYDWKPDKDAMSCLEMIRHVLECEHLFHIIVNKRGDIKDYISPWIAKPNTNLTDEIKFAEPFRYEFFKTIRSFSTEDLDTVEIIRKEKNQKRKLGDYLLRIGYHEAVHAGQFLGYLRTLGLERPLIWD